MKKIYLAFVIALFILCDVSAQKLTAYFSYCTFNQPQGSPFIETYLSVMGNTVKFSPNANQKFQSKIEVQWVLKQGDKIISFDKYNLLSPELNSEADVKPGFLDQQRISAENGKYLLELTVSDKNIAGSKYTISESIEVKYSAEKIAFSDIELLDSYVKSDAQNKMVKSGYSLNPYTSNFFPADVNSIKFYVELYNAKKVLNADDFLVRYQLVNEGNKQILNDLVGYRKMKPENVNTIIAELPLDKVASGNYSLLIEARDKKNSLVAYKSVFFQRSKPMAVKEVPEDFALIDITNTFVSDFSDVDTLKDYLASLYPISGALERQIADNQIALGEVLSMKQFMYYFWAKRDSKDPGLKWADYKLEVEKVNASFSTHNRKGYDTDRGRVYLQYGAPNVIDANAREPHTYPYEIWQYYSIGNQTNRKFVFYAKEGSSNNYELLHSDATGEPSAYDWQLQLQGLSLGPNLDVERVHQSFGNKLDDRFNNPR